MSNPVEVHRSRGSDRQARCAILTISDSRTAATDDSGELIQTRLVSSGHLVIEREIEVDDRDLVRQRLETWLRDLRPDLILTTGGTGVGPRDVTPEAVRPLFDQELPGFGELFRWLSHQQIGSAAMLSRACAGVAGGSVVFVLPGSPKAVQLAMDELILPEVGHLLGLLDLK